MSGRIQGRYATYSSGTCIVKEELREGETLAYRTECLLVGFQELFGQTAESHLNRLIERQIITFAKIMKYYSKYYMYVTNITNMLTT